MSSVGPDGQHARTVGDGTDRTAYSVQAKGIRMSTPSSAERRQQTATPDADGEGRGDFAARAEQYRRELFAHCYRMSGSVHEAEDLVQETFLRAWRGYHAFEERASMRTWLHRIATNVCLTSLEGQARRPLPTGLGQPSADPSEPVHADGEVPWLSPVPDALVASSPEGAAEAQEGIRLAFVAALQHLPPRQRAALVLRDVLRWKAAEVAEAVGTSTAAVNSALQRARETVRKAELTRDGATGTLTPEQNALLERYVQAFWEKDIEGLVGMFTDQAVWEMPPFPGWYQGPRTIGTLIDTQCPGTARMMVMVPTSANGQPAFGLYMRGPDGSYTPFHLQVLALEGDKVAHVGAFFDEDLFATFGLPPALPADTAPFTGVPAP